MNLLTHLRRVLHTIVWLKYEPHTYNNVYAVAMTQSSGFSSNSEANASELLENLEGMFHRYE